MKRRIIINIENDLIDDERAVKMVRSIIAEGRISTSSGRKHYCSATTFMGGGTAFATKRTDTTDTFYIQ